MIFPFYGYKKPFEACDKGWQLGLSLGAKEKKGKGKRIEAFSVGQVRERGRKVGILRFKRRERRATKKREGVVLFLGFFLKKGKCSVSYGE